MSLTWCAVRPDLHYLHYCCGFVVDLLWICRIIVADLLMSVTFSTIRCFGFVVDLRFVVLKYKSKIQIQSQLHKHREANTNSWRDNVNSSVECTASQTRVTVQHSADIATQDSVWTQLLSVEPSTATHVAHSDTLSYHTAPTGHVTARLVPRTWQTGVANPWIEDG